MDNIFTYLKFRSDIDFKHSPFNENDAMVFSLLSGLKFNGIDEGKKTLKEAAQWYKEHVNAPDKDARLVEKENVLYAVADSDRYRDVLFDNYVCDIDKELSKTFYAVTFYTSRYEAFVAFRGTDGSLVSWKENFMTLYEMPTAGQYEALKYLSKVCLKPFMKVTVLGHSKGGNLALFAAMSMDVKLQRKLKDIYLFDAPGFIENIEDKLGYQNIKDRIRAYVPENCVIGNLMNPPYEKNVVVAEGNGVYQHDLFNWNVGKSGLIFTDTTTEYSKEMSLKVNNWIEGMPIEQREGVVEELFGIFEKNEIYHFMDLSHLGIKKIILLIMSLRSLSPENREFFGIIIKQLGNGK